jgi:carbon-monoxide dehydrogenase small subunit
MFGVQANGKEILTIEGLAKDGNLHPLQKAFIEKQGLQCGFCTPGMIMTSYWMLSQNRDLSDEEIKRMLSGNLCRCTGYYGIVESGKNAKDLMRKKGGDSE